PSVPMQLPTTIDKQLQGQPQPSNRSFSCFPSYNNPNNDPNNPRKDYDNASASERLNHPSLFNVFQPGLEDRRFRSSNMEALLRYQETGSQALTSELFRLLSQNLNPQTSLAVGPDGQVKPDPMVATRIRNLLTTRSFDLDWPGRRPWIPDLAQPANAPYRYQMAAPVAPVVPGQQIYQLYPQAAPIPFPATPRGA